MKSGGTYHFDTEYNALKEGLILIRNDTHFEINEFNKNRLESCITAICAKNKFLKPNNTKVREYVYSEATMNTKLSITIVHSKETKEQKTITVRELLSGEEPQTEFEKAGAYLRVEPFSKAAQIIKDTDREQWRNRTSESTII